MPEVFEFQKLIMTVFISCWYFGDVKLKMVLFIFLVAFDLQHAKYKGKLSEMSQMMILVACCGIREWVYEKRHAYFWTYNQ